jgi:hypothetical protein
MNKSNFNNLLRQSISEIFKKNGKISSVSGYGLTEEAKDILFELKELIMETDYFNPDTKAFLSSRYGSYRNFPNNDKCAVNKHTSRSRINYDLSKLKKVLGEDALDKIIKQRDNDLSTYKDKVHELLERHRNKSIIENFTIKLPEYGKVYDRLTEEESEILFHIVTTTSKKYKRTMEGLITEKMLGYILYLEQNNDKLTAEEFECYDSLKECLIE